MCIFEEIKLKNVTLTHAHTLDFSCLQRLCDIDCVALFKWWKIGPSAELRQFLRTQYVSCLYVLIYV